MGDYTRVGLVRTATGWNAQLAPSGTINIMIGWGESAMKKYLGITPASDSATMADANKWVELAATLFAGHYLAGRLANQNIANVTYQRQARTTGDSRYTGRIISADVLWTSATDLCDLHGRDIIIQRVSE